MNQVASPIILAAQLLINKPLTISGPGANLLTISGNNQTRIFNVDVASPGVATFSGLTVANAREPAASGGAILKDNTGALIVSNTSFLNNRAFVRGGAIFKAGTGTISITNSRFSGNNTLDNGGGAIYITDAGQIDITGSTFSSNTSPLSGGAINHFGSGLMNITSSTFSDNVSSLGGGGAIVLAAGPAQIINSTVSGNTSMSGGGPAAQHQFSSDDDERDNHEQSISGKPGRRIEPCW
jgi:predicted outer membrane repeat protein